MVKEQIRKKITFLKNGEKKILDEKIHHHGEKSVKLNF